MTAVTATDDRKRNDHRHHLPAAGSLTGSTGRHTFTRTAKALPGGLFPNEKHLQMPDHLTTFPLPAAGLRQTEAEKLQLQSGKNLIRIRKRHFLKFVLNIVAEPMFMMLAAATSVYFIVGENAEGIMTAVAILIVTAISVFQDVRSSNAVKALQAYTQEKTRVIRDNAERLIPPEDLVPGDIIILEEGNMVPADAKLVHENDFTVNESVITGESFPVKKDARTENDVIYQGTTVNSGMCYASVTAIGSQTQLGKLGKAAEALSGPKTLLQKQVGRYVKQLAVFGITAFVLVWIVNYAQSGMVLQSLLFALVLAMAAIPEEIPVAFSSFMALGAYQLSRLGIISRNPQVIENLGAVDVICLDKTGTITENRMSVKSVFSFDNGKLSLAADGERRRQVLLYAMLASERAPFDAMEKAIVETAGSAGAARLPGSAIQVAEYPLEGRPPMMTHIYRWEDTRIAAGKGAIERILNVCRLSGDVIKTIQEMARGEAAKGYRIIGIASAGCAEGELPETQDGFTWNFEGMLCLYDPPRKNVPGVIGRLHKAGIEVKLLTGDYPETAINISTQVGIRNHGKSISGDSVMAMNEEQLAAAAQEENIFARMFPEAKHRVIKALQAKGHIVAMIGDGVNDVPALKTADIGIAMGEKGAELARGSSDLVITDDNLDKLTEAIRQGRKIFVNLKKSIRYIITIHIPIILAVTLPLILGWPVANIFTPVHIIFLELIMGPTCSLFFEREPVESYIMEAGPRNRREGIMSRYEFGISIWQGLAVTAAVLGLYYVRMKDQRSLEEIRTEVLTALLFANFFLTFANRSFTAHFFQTIRYRNKLAPWVLTASLAFIAVILFVPQVRSVFGLVPLPLPGLLVCISLAFVSVGWYELYKYFKSRKQQNAVSFPM